MDDGDGHGEVVHQGQREKESDKHYYQGLGPC